VCGLTTEEIAQAYLMPAPTLAQRIVRAKGKIRDARIPYEVPTRAELPERLDAVLRVIYLVFNEGYAASSGTSVTRRDLSGERFASGAAGRVTAGTEALGLLALMLLHDHGAGAHVAVRRSDPARRSGPSLWDRDLIAEGTRLVMQALQSPAARERQRAEGRAAGPYAIQAQSRPSTRTRPTARDGLGGDRRAVTMCWRERMRRR